MNKYKMVGFDLEIAEDLPEDGNIDWSVPLGVTCAGWATDNAQGWIAPEMRGAAYAPKIEAMTDLVEMLEQYQQHGFHIVTWNGMGFDFRVMAQGLATDDPLYDRICDLVWNHIDIAFQMRVEKGYMIGLDKAAKGLGLEGKIKGMSGAMAPQMWREGWDAQNKVLEYVVQDAVTMLEVYNALLTHRVLYWITRAGIITRSPWRPTFVDNEGPTKLISVPRRLPTVKEVCQYCEPADTSWMSFQPTPLEEYYGWTGIFP